MNKNLLENPNQPFQIQDNAEAKSLLLELGLLETFSDKMAANNGAGTTQIVTYGEHPTHFIIALLFLGMTLATDNGYYVVCMPKNQFSEQQATELFYQIALRQGFPLGIKPLWKGSANN